MRARNLVISSAIAILVGLILALTVLSFRGSEGKRPDQAVPETALGAERREGATSTQALPKQAAMESASAPSTAKPGDQFEITVNFQHPKTITPAGCLADTGLVFADRGNGQQYGWIGKRATESRERGVHKDKKLDTLIHLTKGYSKLGPHQNAPDAPGGTPGADHVWAITLPNGTYRVFLAMGDATATDHRNHVSINGVQYRDNSENNNFDYHEAIVLVEQGVIEVRAGHGAENPKVCYITIRSTKDPL